MDSNQEDLDAIANADPNFGAAQCSSGMDHSGADTQIDPDFSKPPASDIDPDFLRPSVTPDEEYDDGFNRVPLPDDLTAEVGPPVQLYHMHQLLTRLPWVIGRALSFAASGTDAMKGVDGKEPDPERALELLSIAGVYYELASEIYDYEKHPWLFQTCSAGYTIKDTDIGFSLDRRHVDFFSNEREVRKAFIGNYECVAALFDSNGELPMGGPVTMCGFRKFGKWLYEAQTSLLSQSDEFESTDDENIPDRH